MQDTNIASKHDIIFTEIASFNIKIELNFFINNEKFVDDIYQRSVFIRELKKYLKNFIVKPFHKDSDYTIIIENSHPVFIKNTKTNSVTIPLFERLSEKKIKTYFYLNIYQFQVILRDILFNLTIRNNGCVIHASAVGINNNAYLFLGKSTAGKSTAARLLKDTFTPIADDLVFIRKEKQKYFVYQTPFVEKQWWIKKENKKYELTKGFFLRKGKQTFLENIPTLAYIINLFLDQVLIAKENRKDVIKFSSQLVKSNVQFYFLTFRKNTSDLKRTILSVTNNINNVVR